MNNIARQRKEALVKVNGRSPNNKGLNATERNEVAI